jgi:hypothetical protein
MDYEINTMNLINVERLGGMSHMSQQLESDETNYTDTAGRVFIESKLTLAEAFFLGNIDGLG